jgi:hypothetical protein
MKARRDARAPMVASENARWSGALESEEEMDDLADYVKVLLMLGLPLIIGLWLLTSLEPTGTKVTDDELCRFQIGETTAAQLLAALGEPDSRATVGAGDAPVDLLTYRYKTSEAKEAVVFSFEGNQLREVVATTAPRRIDGESSQPRVLPPCLSQGTESSRGPRAPGPWRTESPVHQ